MLEAYSVSMQPWLESALQGPQYARNSVWMASQREAPVDAAAAPSSEGVRRGAGEHRLLFHSHCHSTGPNARDCDRTKVDFGPLEPDLYGRVPDFTLDQRSWEEVCVWRAPAACELCIDLLQQHEGAHSCCPTLRYRGNSGSQMSAMTSLCEVNYVPPFTDGTYSQYCYFVEGV
jgi:hypothetical protein